MIKSIQPFEVEIHFYEHEQKLVIQQNSMMENARKALKELRKIAIVGDVVSPIDAGWIHAKFL
ncbi:hypothetical protein GMMP15_1340024 [Candidatus Magnetomoraceae bacterium gMMP-15]